MNSLPPSSVDGHLPDDITSDPAQNGEDLQSHEPAKAVQQNLSGLLGDTVELLELQGQLLLNDLKSFWETSRVATLLLIAGMVLALSSIPVLLMGLAWAISDIADQQPSLSFIGTALVCGVLPASGLIWFAVTRLQAGVQTLNQSRQELTRNLAWLKTTIRQNSR